METYCTVRVGTESETRHAGYAGGYGACGREVDIRGLEFKGSYGV